MTRRTLADHAHLTHTNTTIIATLITQTVTRLEQERGGYPSHTPGAAPASVGELQDCAACLKLERVQMRPCPTHDGAPVNLTPVERLAGQHDPAATDLERLTTLIRKLDLYADEAAAICTRWGLPGLTTTDIATRLKDINSIIWCDNCSRYGNHEPKAPEHRNCTPCIEFKKRYGDLPTAASWKARDARGGKWITQDITRIRTREAAERKQKKAS